MGFDIAINGDPCELARYSPTAKVVSYCDSTTIYHDGTYIILGMGETYELEDDGKPYSLCGVDVAVNIQAKLHFNNPRMYYYERA